MFSLLTGLRTRLERRKSGGANVTVFGVTVSSAPNSPLWIGGEVVDWFVGEGGVTSVGGMVVVVVVSPPAGTSSSRVSVSDTTSGSEPLGNVSSGNGSASLVSDTDL